VLVLTCAACSDDTADRLDVFAASSLREAFDDIERAFEERHPGVDVRTTYAGSQILRVQLESGARADVFASADETHAEALEAAGLLDRTRVFATNELVVVVPGDSPLRRFDELDDARRIVRGTPQVPAGRYARRLLERARSAEGDAFVEAVEANVVSEESNVRLVRAKVELGHADAAFVYRTDLDDAIRALPSPPEIRVETRLAVGRLAESAREAHADAYVGLVLSDEGQAILRRHGFGEHP